MTAATEAESAEQLESMLIYCDYASLDVLFLCSCCGFVFGIGSSSIKVVRTRGNTFRDHLSCSPLLFCQGFTWGRLFVCNWALQLALRWCF